VAAAGAAAGVGLAGAGDTLGGADVGDVTGGAGMLVISFGALVPAARGVAASVLVPWTAGALVAAIFA
jgi:hypothetical protein